MINMNTRLSARKAARGEGSTSSATRDVVEEQLADGEVKPSYM